MPDRQPITPVILSGGSGTRLWPVSRETRPKQFLPITEARTMFELTLARTASMEDATAPVIVANKAHADLVAAQIDGPATIILEPCARNTAPAIALAALALDDPAHVMLVMPSDHIIADLPAFLKAIALARPLAEQGWLVTFGITPDAPETGYGYIALGAPLGEGAQRVERFIEKPDAARAAELIAQGNHVWNAGIFMFSGAAFLAALSDNAPEMADTARRAWASAQREGLRVFPDADAFAASPSDSIDYAVMEKSDKVACVPVSMGWSDVGSWDSLHAIAPADDAGNVVQGAAEVSGGAANNLVRSDGPHVTVHGVSDLIVVVTEDEVMILPRGASQEVKTIFQRRTAK